MEARWTRGYRPKIEAQVAYDEITRLKDENGGAVNARNVVDAATPEESPLHPAFEWNDAVAADQYRLEQGRLMIRSIRVVYAEDPKCQPVRAFVTLRTPEQDAASARATEDVMKDPALRSQLLSDCLRQLVSLRVKYRQFQELAIVFREIDALQETLDV
jgi:hypothetical protein